MKARNVPGPYEQLIVLPVDRSAFKSARALLIVYRRRASDVPAADLTQPLRRRVRSQGVTRDYRARLPTYRYPLVMGQSSARRLEWAFDGCRSGQAPDRVAGRWKTKQRSREHMCRSVMGGMPLTVGQCGALRNHDVDDPRLTENDVEER